MPAPDLLGECADLLRRLGVADLIIEQVINTLRQRYSGDTIYIHSLDRRTRNRKIITALQDGLPLEKAAKQADCHVSTARKIRDEWSL